MPSSRKVCFVGGGIGSLAAGVFLIRDGGIPGGQISILEAGSVFPMEGSVRAAQMTVCQLLGIAKPVPPVTPHDRSPHAQFDALIKALK